MGLTKVLGKFFLKIGGWEITGAPPTEKKYICIVAPHTSLRDIFLGKFYNWAMGMKTKIMVKKSFFFFPVGIIIRHWGALPIDRQHAKNIVEQMADHFRNNDEMILAITPEGTRALVKEWKTGFYRIAKAANVPILMTYIDFKTKKIGFFDKENIKAEITGDMKKDIYNIMQKYKGMEGKHPEKFVIK